MLEALRIIGEMPMNSFDVVKLHYVVSHISKRSLPLPCTVKEYITKVNEFKLIMDENEAIQLADEYFYSL